MSDRCDEDDNNGYDLKDNAGFRMVCCEHVLGVMQLNSLELFWSGNWLFPVLGLTVRVRIISDPKGRQKCSGLHFP